MKKNYTQLKIKLLSLHFEIKNNKDLKLLYLNTEFCFETEMTDLYELINSQGEYGEAVFTIINILKNNKINLSSKNVVYLLECFLLMDIKTDLEIEQLLNF